MPVKQFSETKLPNIFLDTCIIQYAANKDMGALVLQYLAELTSKGYSLVISDFIFYELLQGISASREAELVKWLSSFQRFAVDDRVLISAAQLKTLFDSEKIPQEQIGDGDKIISATAILTGSLIITANVNDFPRPFFYEIERKHIIYDHKSTQRMIPIFLLAPDTSVINFRFSNRPKN